MSNATVEMSHRKGDSTMHAFVLFMRFRTLIGTDRSDERFALARELLELPGPPGSENAQVTRASQYWQRPYTLLCEAVAALERGSGIASRQALANSKAWPSLPTRCWPASASCSAAPACSWTVGWARPTPNLTSISPRLTDDARLVASYYAQLIRIRSQQGRIAGSRSPCWSPPRTSPLATRSSSPCSAFAQVASGQPDDAARTMASARRRRFPPDPAQHRLDLRHGDRRGDLRGAPAAGVVPREPYGLLEPAALDCIWSPLGGWPVWAPPTGTWPCSPASAMSRPGPWLTSTPLSPPSASCGPRPCGPRHSNGSLVASIPDLDQKGGEPRPSPGARGRAKRRSAAAGWLRIEGTDAATERAPGRAPSRSTIGAGPFRHRTTTSAGPGHTQHLRSPPLA